MSDADDAATLTPPVSDRDHSAGPETAPITLVEYGDFECPHCGRAYPIVKAVQKHFGRRLRFVFRNFPISTGHPHAQHAAEAAEAAAAGGKFWEMHDRLFENQHALADDDLAAYAAELGLDATQVMDDLTSGRYAARVREQFMSGVRSGVNGTPTFFLNGTRYDASWDRETLTTAIDASLKTIAKGRRVPTPTSRTHGRTTKERSR
jgi:protein-disulfide isomerase